MLPQCAIYGHHAIPDKPSSLLPKIRSNGIAQHNFRQRRWMPKVPHMFKPIHPLPILVEHVAIAHIGNAGATDFA